MLAIPVRGSRQEDPRLAGQWLPQICCPTGSNERPCILATVYTCTHMHLHEHTDTHVHTHKYTQNTDTQRKTVISYSHSASREDPGSGETLSRQPDTDHRLTFFNSTHADTLPFYKCIQFSQFIRQANQDIQRANLEGKFSCHHFHVLLKGSDTGLTT